MKCHANNLSSWISHLLICALTIAQPTNTLHVYVWRFLWIMIGTRTTRIMYNIVSYNWSAILCKVRIKPWLLRMQRKRTRLANLQQQKQKCYVHILSLTAMIYVGQLAGFRNLPSFGWVSESTDLQNKAVYNTMTRVYPPINSFGKCSFSGF